MAEFNWTQAIVVGVIFVLIGGFFSYSFLQKSPTNGTTEEEIQARIDAAVQEKNVEIESLKATISQINKTKTEENVTVVVKNLGGYLLDDLYLENPINELLSDRELNLLDDKVDFNGKSYDMEEVFVINGSMIEANENDFDGNVYLTIPKKSIEYKMLFDSRVTLSEIGSGDDQDTLIFDLLGKEVEISKWDSNEITFSYGDQYSMEEGDSITVDDKQVKLTYITEDEVIVDVDGVSASIKEGRAKYINGLQVKAYDVVYSSYKAGKAILLIGKEVEKTVQDGNEYEDDSIWIWNIDDDERSIGLTLNEEFTKLDEEYSALDVNEKVCLPENYVCVIYNGLMDSNDEEYTFDFDSYDGYIEIDGNFIKEINDYDRVYINVSGIYERTGGNYKLIDPGTINLGDTDSILELSNDSTIGWITSNDFRIEYSLSDLSSYSVWAKDGTWLNISSKDVDYRTLYGILINDPESGIEKEEISITIPEEKLTGSVTVLDLKSQQAINQTTQ